MLKVYRDYAMMQAVEVEDIDYTDPVQVLSYVMSDMDQLEMDENAAHLMLMRVHKVQRALGVPTIMQARYGVGVVPPVREAALAA